MTIPMLDLQRIHEPIADDLRNAFNQILNQNAYIMGAPVEQFEAACASYLGVKHAIGVSSGTDALLLALMALEVGPGDEVICPSYTFFATAGAVARLGATPIFVDLDPATYNWDLEQVFAARTPRTKAVIPVHLFGLGANLQGLMEWGESHQIAVIEDVAQAMGATYQNQQAGSLGDFGCFSFFPSKNLGGFGDGGLLVSSNDRLAERARILRTHGAKPKYHHAFVGGNFRLDALQAALLSIKLPHLDSYISQRQAVAQDYFSAFRRAGLQEALFLPHLPDTEQSHTFNQFIIRLPNQEARDGIQAHLKAAGIATAIYYPKALHQQACFATETSVHLPQAERAAETTLALPIFPGMQPEEINQVVSQIATYFGI